MMVARSLFFIAFCGVLSQSLFGQIEIRHFQGHDDEFMAETLDSTLFTNSGFVNNGLDNGNYWISIEGISEPSIVQIPNDHIHLVTAYMDGRKIERKRYERFVTYEVDKGQLYLNVEADREAYIPVSVKNVEAYAFAEKKNLLFIGVYFGFVVVVVVLNLLYFQSFKDLTFLYYALFLIAVSYGLFIKDGVFFFFGMSRQFILINEVFIHVAAAIICGYFSTSYLNLDFYYKWLKPVRMFLNAAMIIPAVLYLYTLEFNYFIIMDVIVFSVLTFYWSFGWVFVKKNVFTKLFVFAFWLILFSGVNFFVAQLMGFTLIDGVNAAHLNKAGGFVEMLMLSFGVFYRMQVLQSENKGMREAILNYTNQIQSLSAELEKNKEGNENHFTSFDLSFRENQILTLITQGKSNKQIADEIFVSVNTVKYHIKNIYQKLHISSRKEALSIKL